MPDATTTSDVLRTGPEISELFARPGAARRLQQTQQNLLGDPRTPEGTMGTISGALEALSEGYEGLNRAPEGVELTGAPKSKAALAALAAARRRQALGLPPAITAGNRVKALSELEHIPETPLSATTRPDARVTGGQPSVESLLGPQGYAAQEKRAVYQIPKDRREEAAQLRQRGQEVLPMSKALRLDQEGLWARDWYSGALPEIANQVGMKDALMVAKQIAATSPRADPLNNVNMAFRAYTDWIAKGRPPTYTFPGFMGAYRANLMRAINMKKGKGGLWEPARDAEGNLTYVPLEGQKVSNYLLNLLGSEQHKTVDRWMVHAMIGLPSTEANITRMQYQVTANRIDQIAQRAGTSPERLQASMWSAIKMADDERMMDLVQKGLTKRQVVPPIRDVIRWTGERYRRMGLLPENPLPGVVLGIVLAEYKLDPLTLFEEHQKADVAAERGAARAQ